MDPSGELIDQGIAILYEAPASYTGEDVLELQGHGSPVILQRLVDTILTLDVRMANPGEYTQRAFLNNKLDLTQAEAVADLIASSSEEAAKAAMRSLRGAFATEVNALDAKLLKLRVYIEGALDFAEEEIDLLSSDEQLDELEGIQQDLDRLLDRTTAGQMLQQGLDVVIAGKPNVGKSSLLNCLLGEDRAIVTATAGTTRDTIDGIIHIDGFPVRLLDTAGLHDASGSIEQEGIRRARAALTQADLVLWVIEDGKEDAAENPDISQPVLCVLNKCDLTENEPCVINSNTCRISALHNQGISGLLQLIREKAGITTRTDIFSGRPRHVIALKEAKQLMAQAKAELEARQPDLIAENLRLAHLCFGNIVGVTTQDELLGEIFSTFCIGK